MSEIREVVNLYFSPFGHLVKAIMYLNLAGLLLIFLDLIHDFKNKNLDTKQTLADFFVGVPHFLINHFIGRHLIIFSCFYFFRYQIIEIPTHWLSWLACFLLVDFCYYWIHRFEHKFKVFWFTHSVHHSSTNLQLSSNLRISWFEFMYVWIFILPPILLGFNPAQVIICVQVIAFYQLWVHTKKIKKLPRFFEYIFVTPSHHRVHHGFNSQYINKNFSGIFIIWDRIFKTFALEEETVQYGLTKQVESINPIKINLNQILN